jgi:hypothetical protein
MRPAGSCPNEPFCGGHRLSIAERTSAGGAASAESVPRRPEYTDAKTLPTIATPRVRQARGWCR